LPQHRSKRSNLYHQTLARQAENGHIPAMKSISIVAAVIALGIVLGGCSKCGPFWDDWHSPAKSCQGDLPK
jgi:hypothetical protein